MNVHRILHWVSYHRSVPISVILVSLSIANSRADVLTFQQGAGGYTQAKDAPLYFSAPNLNSATANLNTRGLGTANEAHTLMQFDGIFGNLPTQIPLGSTINSATLRVFHTGFTVPTTGAIHRMLIPWSDLTATWNLFTNGLDNNPAGEFVPTPGFNGSTSGIMTITTIVQDWSNGAPNYGMAILPTSTGGISYHSSDTLTVDFRPLLTVDFTPAVPEPGGLAIAAICGSLLALRRRRSSR